MRLVFRTLQPPQNVYKLLTIEPASRREGEREMSLLNRISMGQDTDYLLRIIIDIFHKNKNGQITIHHHRGE